ncbi:helix-turn-helix transcriptional regulator [Salinicola salarius]|uniref:helix-turn-helix transcriptional regulator n=1 Tax=Salinicola salarius TaxID=430457 RepID=UPI000DA14BF5|nr:helix-turn-helix transcriptional regulator [Salinicola salarius]
MNDPRFIGEEVIGQPGQNLTPDELALLVWQADGRTPSEIEQGLGFDRFTVRQLEASARAKLGGKTKAHTLSRAFIFEVLAPRALCLLLCIFSINAYHADGAQRAPKRSRAPITAMSGGRVAKSKRSDGPLPDVAAILAIQAA